MRYLLLILLLAGGYYGWDYYQNGLAPRHEALKAMEQEPCPELDAAQARFDEAAELHEQQAVRLQKAVQRKEEAVRKYWDARIKQAGQEKDGKKTPSPVNGRPNARSAEARIAYLLEQYDRRVAEVEKLKSRRQELERITDQGEAALRDQTEAYEKAKRELGLFQNNVDRQIASLRDSMNSPLAEDYDETEILSEDPEFRTMIAPYDQAVSHEETIVMRTEADVEEKAKALHGLQRVRDAKIEEERSRLRQEEEIFFTAATAIGVILLISILLSFARRR